MNEILSLIKTKERVIIASAMSAFAVVLAVVIGIVSGATNEGHTHRFDFHLEMGEDGELNLVGDCFDGECKDPHHVMDITDGLIENVVTAATCCSDGVTEYSYFNSADGLIYTYTHKVSALPHSYVGQKSVDDNGSLTIIADCVNEGCTIQPVTVGDSNGLKVVSTVAATCHTPKIESFAFNVNGVDSTVTVITEEDVPHKLNGTFVTDFLLSEGVYKYDTIGMTLVNEKTVACGMTADATYVCEECGQAQSVTVGKVNHNFLYVEDESEMPTTSAAGKAYIKCLNTDCTEEKSIELPRIVENETATIIAEATEVSLKVIRYSYVNDEYGINIEFDLEVGDKLSHNYAYNLVPNSAGEFGLALVGVCSQPGCQTPDVLYTDGLTITFTNTSTCHTPGKIIWTCVWEGEKYYFELPASEDDMPSHNIQYAPELIILPTTENNGFAYLVCVNDGCTQKFGEQIPAVVEGENAEFDRYESNENGDFKVLNYFYHSESLGFTVDCEIWVETHIHRYEYRLHKAIPGVDVDLDDNIFFLQGTCYSQFGECDKPEMSPEEVVPEFENTSNCVEYGEFIWTYEREGVICIYTEKSTELIPDAHTYSIVKGQTPSFEYDGVAHVVCTNEGCREEHRNIVLPKMEIGKNTVSMTDEEGNEYYLYTYIIPGFEIKVTEIVPVTN